MEGGDLRVHDQSKDGTATRQKVEESNIPFYIDYTFPLDTLPVKLKFAARKNRFRLKENLPPPLCLSSPTPKEVPSLDKSFAHRRIV